MSILLFIHIAFGTIALFAGSINLMVVNGSKLHKLVGKIYVLSMLLVGITALVISLLKDNEFLLLIGVFSTYLVLSGYQYLKLKKNEKIQIKTPYLLSLLMTMFAVWMIINAIESLIKLNMFGLVHLTFGLISLSMCIKDFKFYSGKRKLKNDWLLCHLQRMIAAYIATFTAFLVVNIKYDFLPSFVWWLLPTAAFTPLIFYYSSKFAVK